MGRSFNCVSGHSKSGPALVSTPSREMADPPSHTLHIISSSMGASPLVAAGAAAAPLVFSVAVALLADSK